MRGFSGRTDLESALEILRGAVEVLPPLEEESVPLEEALGRPLAADVVSSVEVPAFDKSAMDGYALQAAETFGASPTDPALFRVIGEILPGDAGAELLAIQCQLEQSQWWPAGTLMALQFRVLPRGGSTKRVRPPSSTT